MNAHFFDIDTLITLNNKVWIVSKSEPNNPIVKIDQSEFNLIKKGIYKVSGELVSISNKEYWLPKELIEKIKIRCKNKNLEISSLFFSMQEFMSPEIINQLDYTIWKEHLIRLKNTIDDIYIICSKNAKNNYSTQVEKLEKYLNEELGLRIKNFYFISETFYNRDLDEIAHKKVRLLLQHLVGLKTDVDKFTSEGITKYNIINFYDDDKKTIELSKSANVVLKFLFDNSDQDTQKLVKSAIEEKPELNTIEITHNNVNPYLNSKTIISLDRIIKTFESFRY
jgi:hypothetical protein